MGRVGALVPQLGALGHTKTVLLVDHHKAQAGKLYGVLDNGVGANKYVDGSVHQSVEHFLSALAFYYASEQGHTQIHILKKSHDGLQMLLGQYLGRSHDTGLIAVVDGNEHRHQCHKRLAATYIALQQTVHLSAGTHVLTYLAYHALLCSGEWERQVLTVECVEHIADFRENVATIFAALVARVP